MSYITSRELAEAIKLDKNTVNTWLDGYRFTKYRMRNPIKMQPKVVYNFNNDFKEDFKEFLSLRQNFKALKNFNNFIAL